MPKKTCQTQIANDNRPNEFPQRGPIHESMVLRLDLFFLIGRRALAGLPFGRTPP